MSHSLQLLFETINQAKDEQSLRLHVIPKIGEYFVAKRRGLFFFDQLFSVNQKLQKTIKTVLAVEHNPVTRYLVERHAPVHEALVTSPTAWTTVCPRPDHWHVMAGPIVSGGQLVGIVGCTREQSMPSFDTQNLADLSAICLHLSVWTSTIRSQRQTLETVSLANSKAKRLTPRELQIAELVALGRTNAAIGSELWITENSVKQALKRMFRKLEVSSRTEMVAQLVVTKDISSKGSAKK
ncbi:MAG: LuxR C-terminal-related transcriptional regulator [Cyanobacteria bacterium P01_H01_bin.105]